MNEPNSTLNIYMVSIYHILKMNFFLQVTETKIIHFRKNTDNSLVWGGGPDMKSFLRQILEGSKFPQHSVIRDHYFVEKVYSGKVVENFDDLFLEIKD